MAGVFSNLYNPNKMAKTNTMTYGITQGQIKLIKTLQRQLNIPDEVYRELLHNGTSGRTTRTTELQQQEAAALITALQAESTKDKDAADVMRKKIISMAHRLGWKQQGTERADMQRIDNWCQTSGYLHKPLNSYSYAELPKLVSQFTQMYLSYQNQTV